MSLSARIREREARALVVKSMTDALKENAERAQRELDLAEAELEALKREMALGGVVIASAAQPSTSNLPGDDAPLAEPEILQKAG